MDLKELMEKTIIKFPREIDFQEAEKIIECLSEKMPANINYWVKKSLLKHNEGNLKNNVENKFSEIRCEVIPFRTGHSEFLYFKISNKSSLNFTKIKSPWGDSEERLKEMYSHTTVFLDNTRKIVNDYFKEVHIK